MHIVIKSNNRMVTVFNEIELKTSRAQIHTFLDHLYNSKHNFQQVLSLNLYVYACRVGVLA